MLRCASSFVIAAYAKVRLIPQDSRALPAAFLRSRPIFSTSKTFYEVVHNGLLIIHKSPADRNTKVADTRKLAKRRAMPVFKVLT
jgi:hypothetical protein